MLIFSMNKKLNKKYLDETPFDAYESKMQKFINKGKFHRVDNYQESKKELIKMAKHFLLFTMRKNQSSNIIF